MDLVSEHTMRVSEHVSELQEQISAVVSSAIEDIDSYLQRSIDVPNFETGKVASSSRNASALGVLPNILRQSLARAGYYDLVSEFAVSLQDQVGYFRAIYEEDSETLNLPEMSIDHDGLEVLTSAASLSVVAMESSVDDAANRLARLAPRMLGNESMSSMIRETQTIVRRISNTKSMALDQVMLFYRLLANSVYRVVEAENHPLTYSLVGPNDGSTSDECGQILSGDNKYTWDQLHELKNADETSFAHSGGHFGCRHWFRATGQA